MSMRLMVRVAVGATWLAWAACAAVVAPAGPPSSRPNVMLIISDDQHWGDYGFMGHEHLRTPHLDRLARESLLFRWGYVTDNGWIQDPASPGFAPRSKRSPYDGGLRTPIMLRRPGGIRPRSSDALASAVDITPTVLAACGVESPARPATSAAPSRRPNLLVFLADDLGARDLGCTGSSFYRTPAIDALAAAGTTFTQAYAAAPVCSPTRAALLTGKFPARVGITNFIGGERRGSLLQADYLRALPAEEVTIAERLSAVGYTTGIFGKWHLGPPADVQSHGFDVTGSIDVPPGRGPADDPHHARAIARQAAEFIAACRDRPFFCYVPLHSVHVPLRSTADRVTEARQRAENVKATGPKEVPERGRTARAIQDHPVYAAMIEEMDDAVSTVLAAVEEQGVANDTLVVFTSDNGGLTTAEGSPTSNLPLRAGKGYLFEGGIRVPLVVRWPGVAKSAATSDVPVTTLDIAATVLDAGGASPPPDEPLDGTSLRSVLDGSGMLPARDLVWHYPHYSNQGSRPGAAILAGDSPAGMLEKLILHDEGGRVELFDLVADEGERRDLAGARPERAAALRARLEQWQVAVGARRASLNPDPVDPYGPEGLPPKTQPAPTLR